MIFEALHGSDGSRILFAPGSHWNAPGANRQCMPYRHVRIGHPVPYLYVRIGNLPPYRHVHHRQYMPYRHMRMSYPVPYRYVRVEL